MIEESKAFCVYKITNKINGKIYIGKTGDVEDRWSKHLSAVKSMSKKKLLIHQAMAEDGVNNFTFQIIEYCNNEAKALNQERFWIDYHKTNVCKYGSEFGYNKTAGGQGVSGFKHSEESRQKMSEAQSGEKHYNFGKAPHNFGKSHTKETRQKMSIARSGENNPMFGKTGEKSSFFGKTHTEETRQKISKANSGENSKKAKITERQVINMLNDYYTGNFTGDDLANKYQLKLGSIHQIISGKNWKHIQRDVIRIEQVKVLNKNQKGEKNKTSKLTEEQVIAIYNDPRTQVKIAAEYQINQTTVSVIKIGKTWSHLTGHIKKNK